MNTKVLFSGIIYDDDLEIAQTLTFNGLKSGMWLFTGQQFDVAQSIQSAYGILLNSQMCIGASLPMANYSTATSSSDGLMSSTDKAKLDSLSSSGGSSALTELADITISSPADGHILEYDSATSKWINVDLTTTVNSLINTALAEYGDGDTETYG